MIHHDQIQYDDSKLLREKSNRSLHETYSRRTLLSRIAGLGAAGVLLPGLLTACGNENDAERNVASGPCADRASLSVPGMASRRALDYVDESPYAEKTCSNCRFFTQPDGECGGCQIVRGPIAPAGYCNSWGAQNE